MLLRKNVNNDVSKDSPIEGANKTNMLKKVSEELDSYKTALELISREINNQRSGDLVEHASNNHRESHFVEEARKRKKQRNPQVNKGINCTRQVS